MSQRQLRFAFNKKFKSQPRWDVEVLDWHIPSKSVPISRYTDPRDAELVPSL